LLTISFALGGLGLLLLGMHLMTEGLKSAAGHRLHDLLERTTQTRFRAAMTGFGITAIVQSSSAVIVTTLGFTNAGMLKLKQAAWVVFGSNLGTTMTAWIVALVGLKLNVDVIAMPMIGLGMLLKLLVKKGAAPHLGVAFAGFGLLFLGLDVLQENFDDLATQLPFEQLNAAGVWGIILGVLIGALLTALIQSSSASIAIILSASTTGVLSPLLAASLIIGANLGTTATSVLTTIGATANAKRLAWLHVLEKFFTALIALLLLPSMWWVSSKLMEVSGPTDISAGLALFHTLFNVLSLFLMAGLADRLIRLVERLVKQPDLSSELPRYIDDTVLSIPAMGISAMQSELKRVFKQLLQRAMQLSNPAIPVQEDERYVNTSVLLKTIERFSHKLGTQNLGSSSEAFLNLNWAIQECSELRVLLHELSALGEPALNRSLTPELRELLLSVFALGQLKQLSAEHREICIERYKQGRRKLRQKWLSGVANSEAQAIVMAENLQVLALFEESIKRVLRVAEALYPAQSEETIPETKRAVPSHDPSENFSGI